VAEYIVYRTNGASRRAVARVEAASEQDACRLASNNVALSAGESLSAELAEAADAREAERNRTSRDLARDTRGGEGPMPEG